MIPGFSDTTAGDALLLLAAGLGARFLLLFVCGERQAPASITVAGRTTAPVNMRGCDVAAAAAEKQSFVASSSCGTAKTITSSSWKTSNCAASSDAIRTRGAALLLVDELLLLLLLLDVVLWIRTCKRSKMVLLGGEEAVGGTPDDAGDDRAPSW